MNKTKLAFEPTEQAEKQPNEEERFSTLETVSAMVAVLTQREIRYCHWKSNSRLDWGLSGRTDLDLLVDPRHKKLFREILTELGIKRLVAPPGKQYPGLEHYLGFDPSSGKLFHLHVHYNLVLGEQYVKNYRLPIVSKVLDKTRDKFDVKIPLPEVEVIILSIRALLKYRDRDGFKDIFSIRHPGIPEHILNELLWLLEQTSEEKLSDTLNELSIFSDNEMVLEFLSHVQHDPRNGWELIKLRSRLRKALRPYQRESRLLASMKYFLALIKKSNVFKGGGDQLLRFPGGGRLIALIGIDGSGKSTQTANLAEWLQWKVSAPLYYLGSKQPSLWSNWSYLIFRAFRRSHSILSPRIGEDNIVAKTLRRFRQFFLAAHYLSVGMDRYKRYVRGKKEAHQGSIVIFDRFPFFSPLDGPEIHLMSERKLNYLTKKLSAIERRLYQSFKYLDLLIVLDVSPEISVQRKPDHSMETILSKYDAMQRLKEELSEASSNHFWVSIDSDNSMEQVMLELKRAVWSEL